MSMTIGSVGSMSQISLARMHQEMFKKADQNGDGTIDKTEFAAIGQRKDSSKADEIFGQIDTDGDGVISEAESDAFLTKMEEARQPSESLTASAAGQDWQAGILQALLAHASRSTQDTQASIALYV